MILTDRKQVKKENEQCQWFKKLKPQHLGMAVRACSFLTIRLCITECDTVWPMDYDIESLSQFILFFIYNKFSVTNKPVSINGLKWDQPGTLLYSYFMCTHHNPTQPPVVDFREQKSSENTTTSTHSKGEL